jgi:hypothetical protein
MPTLTTLEIQSAIAASRQPENRGKIITKSDGGSLYLFARNGNGSWVYQFRDPRTGKLRCEGLGSHTEVTLKRARDLRARKAVDNSRLREALKNGAAVMPVQTLHAGPEGQRMVADAPSLSEASGQTFGYWAERYLRERPGKKPWKHDTIGRRTRWLRELCTPLSKLPIEGITREMVADIIWPRGGDGRRTWDGVRERARPVIEAVFNLADVSKNPASLERLNGLAVGGRHRDGAHCSAAARFGGELHRRRLLSVRGRA